MTTRTLQAIAVFCLANLASAAAISAGGNHSLQLASDGRVWSWGINNSGQLGTGDIQGRGIPTLVLGLTSIQSVAACNVHSLALKTDGTVWSWGANGSGQLGDGGVEPFRLVPAQVSGLTGITMISCGSGGVHNLALKNDGTVWAWGGNNTGQVGDGTTINRLTPFQVPGLASIIAVGAGNNHSLAVQSNGSVLAWGANNNGQLGDGTTIQKTSPVAVSTITGITAVAGGANHSLALKNNNTVFAWGQNVFGQLGDGTTTNRSTPVQVTGLTTAIGIDAGNSHSLARMSDNTVRAWGFNQNSELGDSNAAQRTTATAIAGLVGVLEVSGGTSHSLALLANDEVMGWGLNGFGALGIGRIGRNPIAEREIDGLAGVTAVAAGLQHSLARKSDGTVWSWGFAQNGQLGVGPNGFPQSLPVQVPGLSSVLNVAAGNFHSLAVKSDGSVMAWGGNANGQLGDSTTITRFSPVQVTGLLAGSGVIAVAAAVNHSLALKSDGTVLAWGTNVNGQLGDGTNTQRNAPVTVTGLGPGSGVIAISAGGNHSLALKNDGTVWAWGSNVTGEIGDGTTTDRNVPTQVVGLTAISAISAGGNHNLALRQGVVWSWGQNAFGQLGTGNSTQALTPVQVAGLTGVTSISAGVSHSLAIKGGVVWSWGFNASGQLGNASDQTSLLPTESLLLIDAVSAVSAKSSNHNLVILSDGNVASWGQDVYGQLGDGNLYITFTPTPTVGLGVADLKLSITHTGSLTQGTNIVYTFTVTNVGGASQPGPIAFDQLFPPGLTLVSATGPGWTCAPNSGFLQCANPASIAAGASLSVKLTAAVGAGVSPGATTGAGLEDPDANRVNDTAGDSGLIQTNTSALPQFTFGGAWYTALYFTNTTDAVARAQVNFLNDDSTPLIVSLQGIGSVSSQSFDLLPHSTVIFEAPNGGNNQAGWAEVTLPAGVTGYAVFRQTVDGRPDQEAVVPLTPETSTTADLTYDDILFTTAVAFLNPTGATETVTIDTFGANGASTGSTQFVLGPHVKKSDVLKNFAGLGGIAGNRGRAVFSVSNGAVSVLGLRFGGSAFTSIPVVHRPATPVTQTVSFALPQFVFSGAWYTALYFSNTTNAPVNVPVNFVHDDGTPLTAVLSGIGSVTSQNLLLNPGTTSILEGLADAAGTTVEGWVDTALPPGVTGYAVFRQTVAGRPDQEAVVPLTSESSQAGDLIYDDMLFTTAVAFLNPTGQQTTVTITAYSAGGVQIGTAQVVLGPHAKFSDDLKNIPGLSSVSGNRGWASFSVAGGDVSLLGLRFGGSAFTSIPVSQQ